MIRVHHLNNSRSQRVLWLLEEVGATYEVIRYQRKPNMLAPRELKRVHPLGKSPVIEDRGKTFAETGLIVEYLVESYGPDLAPARLRMTGKSPRWRGSNSNSGPRAFSVSPHNGIFAVAVTRTTVLSSTRCVISRMGVRFV